MLPRDPEQRLEYFRKKNEMINRKYEEDIQIAKKQGKFKDEEQVLIQMEELEKMDEVALKKVMRDLRIKKQEIPENISEEEKKLLEED